MSQSTFTQQYRLLLWKNFKLKVRRPLATFFELIIPIGVVIILLLVRRISTRVNYGQCYLREKQMDSLGPLPFLKDFLCTFNSTCYNQSQNNWNDESQNDFLTFINNFTALYSIYPSGTVTVPILTNWITVNIVKLGYSVTYMMTTLTPVLQALPMTYSTNPSTVLSGIYILSTYVCGSTSNDMLAFLSSFVRNNSVSNSTSCKASLLSTMGNGTFADLVYPILAPIFFGKIYYTPSSPFIKELLTRANFSFVILDNLRQASTEWRVNFNSWMVKQLANSANFKTMIETTVQCSKSSNQQLAQICIVLNGLLNTTSIQSLITTLTMVFTSAESYLNCLDLNKFVVIDSPSVLDTFSADSLIDVLAGIVFDPSFQYVTRNNATFLNYTIRMPTVRIDSTTNYKVLDRFWTPYPRRSTLSNMRYYTSGFLMLQEAIDRAFISLVTNNQITNIGSSIQMMPTPCYVVDQFIQFASTLMPFFLVIGWAPIFANLVKSIVYEKEKRLKEFMLVMGLSQSVHWLAWFTISLIITVIPCVICAVILKYVKILPLTNIGVSFLLLFSYAVSFISQAFMFSVCFNKANIASVVSGLLYFVFYIPFVILVNVQDQLTFSIYFATGILAQVSFCNGWYFIANWEQAMVGAQFSNFYQSTVLNLNFGVGHCIALLWIDTAIYLIITWYVEAVFPGEFGIPKPWYFFVTKHYWCQNRSCCPSADVTPYTLDAAGNPRTFNADNDSCLGFEEVNENLKVGISIQNLMKKFSSMKVPSVDNLNLDFYKSQITAFLGHNGAGKTTTISMLTGIFPPTSGTAFISDKDIRYDIDSIRKILGLCPQHNILFDNLTVEDHIYFYGLLKGMSLDEIKTTLPGIVDDVGLTKKIKTQSKQLSGGMKRKLSVAMAFIGGSQAIFLDEPTAGVDPFARRGIWDLLIKYRGPEKTIVLTTHHMDEADYLSDRIAIISQGKLKCCGSSVFLKRQFGDGYSLILVKTARAQKEEFTENQHSESGKHVFQFVKKQINNAKFVDETRTQWNIILPLDGLSNNGFANLFQSLDSSLAVLNVASYGLSDTSLEDVFLKVADDPSKLEETEHVNNTALANLSDEGDLPRPSSRLSLTNRSDLFKSKEKIVNNVETTVDYTLLTGMGLLRQQLAGLEIKRFHYTKRNIKGLFAELIMPLIMIIIIVGLLNNINPLSNQPQMIIHPWLMMPQSRGTSLITFYKKETTVNAQIDQITNTYQTDVGESGIRCMNSSVYSLPNFQCSPTVSQTWSAAPVGNIPQESAACDCNTTGFQQCADPTSGGPASSYRVMASSDTLNNLTGYNISDNLIKKFSYYAQKQYGGYQILIPNYFGLSCSLMGNLALWTDLRDPNNGATVTSVNFVNYFQQFLQLSGIRTNYSRIWINNKGYVSWPAYANIFDNVLLRSLLNSSVNASNYGIVVSTHPFKYSQTDLQSMLTSQLFLSVSLADFVILALALIPASFVLFLIEERVSGSKRQQFVSGVDPYVYWVSNFCWDIVKYLISVFLIILVFVAYNYQLYIGTKNIAAFIVLLCLYGFAVIPHMYPFSFLISTPSTAFVVLSAYNMFVGALTTIATFFLDQLQTTQPDLASVNDVLKKIFLIFPQYGLGRGLMDISSKYLQYNISNGVNDYDPFAWDVIGKNLTSFGILFVSWWIVVFLCESSIFKHQLCCKSKVSNQDRNVTNNDEDVNVALERDRVKRDTSDGDLLRVIDLTKIYHSSLPCKSGGKSDEVHRKLAVDNICFGVKAGECFGLLGVNGAGKTTTFKMLTGEETVTEGEATINDKSIISDMVDAHRNMGFCPQFDALHPILTCEEELYFYCRIRGIKSSLIKSTVESSFLNLSLTPHATKTTENLSGGNKRKLSTAISLIGSPKVIFMDEPTSGMDAGARRFLWTAIQKLINQQRAVILTSHNMEECEVLCHRLAIMVNGKFQCLGSVQQLKSEFGDDYYVTLRMNSNCDENGDRDKIKDIIDKEFSDGVFLKDENFITLQYKMDPGSYKLHVIFDFFENLKSTGLIVDYSVSQTTLDEIFINFAKKEDISLIRSAGSIRRASQNEKEGYANPSYDETNDF